ncbi:hypothetical protein IAU60_005853 [Kwoniella sp. DSM 27419]
MRQKRAKTYKRVMELYTRTFGFRQPFQVLVSQDLLLEGAKSDLNMHKQFLQVTQGECKPMITQCCMEALYKLGKDVQRTTDLAKTFERRKCNHRTALEADECLQDVIGATNKHRYVLASQSGKLRVALQNIPGLPIVHFNPRGVLVLSPPSTATVREKNKVEEARRVEGAKELDGVVDGGNVVGAPTVAAGSTVGRKKTKGVNPLSAKKKKVTIDSRQPATSEVEKKRRRDSDAGADGEGDHQVEKAVAAGEEAGEGGKKKRKRRKKSAVKDAIAELNAEAEAEQRGRAVTGGSESGASDDE